MDIKHLEENFAVLINDINSVKSKKHTNLFIRYLDIKKNNLIVKFIANRHRHNEYGIYVC